MPRKPPPEGETKKQRFKRMAEARVNVVIERLRIIGNLSNRSIYNYNDADVDKIFDTLDEKLKESKARFKRRNRERFKL